MRPSILEKVATHISEPLDTECKAVYFLVELRKLFEMEGKHEYKDLRLMANWALHVDLDRNPVSHILKELSLALEKYNDPSNEDAGYEHLTNLFLKFLFTGSHRREMRSFLSNCGLPTLLCDDATYWLSFIRSYAGVISDGSLVNKNALKPDDVEWLTFEAKVPRDENRLWVNIGVTLSNENTTEVLLGATLDQNSNITWEMHGPK